MSAMNRSPRFVPALPTPTEAQTAIRQQHASRAVWRAFAKWGRRPSVEIVLWQNRLRVAFAAGVAAVAALLRITGVLPGDPAEIIWPTIAYIALISVLGVYVSASRNAPAFVVALLILADLAVIFTVAAVATPAAYYSRILVLAFLVLVFAEFHFGTVATAVAIGGTIAGYGILLAREAMRGGPIQWAEEVWLITIWLVVAATFAALQAAMSRRLARLADLFGRAQQGDFTHVYDDRSDVRPDAITMVGRAYNEFRSQLAAMVLTDPLSGCYNRRGFQQHLQRILMRASRIGAPVTVLLIDIDWFKSVNDTWGHLAGDSVIRELGGILQQDRRPRDVCARIGGEEFAVVLSGVGVAGAKIVANKIRAEVAAHRFAAVGGTRQITVSVGAATAPIRDPRIAEDLQARADEALYAAKRAGRNRAVVWPGGSEDERTIKTVVDGGGDDRGYPPPNRRAGPPDGSWPQRAD